MTFMEREGVNFKTQQSTLRVCVCHVTFHSSRHFCLSDCWTRPARGWFPAKWRNVSISRRDGRKSLVRIVSSIVDSRSNFLFQRSAWVSASAVSFARLWRDATRFPEDPPSVIAGIYEIFNDSETQEEKYQKWSERRTFDQSIDPL